MPYIKKEIWAGDVYECEVYFAIRKKGKRYSRGKNENLTIDEQKEINNRHSLKKLSRLINTNFGPGDIFITLTHEVEIPIEEAKKELQKFLRKLRIYRKKNGMDDLKYIAVTENSDREHHHLVINRIDLNVLNDLWKLGIVLISTLRNSRDYKGLAKYITKEPAVMHKKRWTQSKNLKQPKVKEKEIKKADKLVNAPKGYKILEHEYFFSDLTGDMQYLKAVKVGGIDYAYSDG